MVDLGIEIGQGEYGSVLKGHLTEYKGKKQKVLFRWICFTVILFAHLKINSVGNVTCKHNFYKKNQWALCIVSLSIKDKSSQMHILVTHINNILELAISLFFCCQNCPGPKMECYTDLKR